jgi:flagellar hook assembly protein FlgD
MIRALFAALVLAAAPSHALEITNVSHVPAAIDPAKREAVEVRFRLSESARVTLRIFDGRDLLVRTVAAPKSLPAGDAKLVWDGRDEKGRPVPPEAYVYTLTATPSQGEPVEFDLTDLTGNEELPLAAPKWDASGHLVHYELSAPARVVIRAGLNNGPLLRTIIDWVPRTAGAHDESWDGKDASGLIDASSHPDLQLGVEAWALPKNAVIVLPTRPTVELIAKLEWPEVRRVKKRSEPLRERALHQQPIEQRSDVRVRLSLPGNTSHDSDGALVARGQVPIQLDVDDADRARLLAQRFEIGFFVDGKYIFENEVGFLPVTFSWDAGAVNEGVHYVTGNVWGYAGQFGTTTIKVRAAGK